MHTARLKLNGRYLADDILKYIFIEYLDSNFKSVNEGVTDNMSVLVQVTARC